MGPDEDENGAGVENEAEMPLAESEIAAGSSEATTEPSAEAKTEPLADGATEKKNEETTSKNEVDSLEAKIIRQMEYYFGDMNLMKDKYMQTQIKESTDGWIMMDVLITFNRLKALSTDIDLVLKALKKSKSGLLEVDEEGKKIRRDPNKPLPEKSNIVWDEQNKKTVYVKGFPLDTNIEAILKYFEEYESIKNVMMRRHFNTKIFKGSVFLTFSGEEEATAFAKKEGLKFGDSDLLIEAKVDYVVRKKKEVEERKKASEERKKSKQDKNQDEDNDDSENPDKSKKSKPERSRTMGEFKPENISKGCLLKVTGLCEKVSWDAIKRTFREHAEIAFVEFQQGDKEAIVRFHEKGSAELALNRATEAAKDNKIMICDGEVEAAVVDGEEEISFWRKFWEHRRNAPSWNHSTRGRGRGRGRGSRGGFNRRGGKGDRGNRKRPAEDSPAEPKGKQVKHKHFDDS